MKCFRGLRKTFRPNFFSFPAVKSYSRFSRTHYISSSFSLIFYFFASLDDGNLCTPCVFYFPPSLKPFSVRIQWIFLIIFLATPFGFWIFSARNADVSQPLSNIKSTIFMGSLESFIG